MTQKNIFNIFAVLISSMIVSQAFAAMPVTKDQNLKSLLERGFYQNSLSVNFITANEDDDQKRILAVLDQDLNVHFLECNQSDMEYPKEEIDWSAIYSKNLKSEITVNTALFGPPQAAKFKDFLLSLSERTSARMSDQQGTLITCAPIETFSQQELTTVAEKNNSWGNVTVGKVAAAITYGWILRSNGYVNCTDDEFSPYYRIQNRVTTTNMAIDECKSLQAMQGSKQGYIYSGSVQKFNQDVWQVRQLLNKFAGKPVETDYWDKH